VFAEIEQGTKRVILIWHRRSGKEATCLNVQIKYAWNNPGTHYYFFPTYQQGRKVLWEGINSDAMKFIDHIPKELRIGRPREDDMQIRMKTKCGNESVWQVVGVDRVDSIMGTNPISCVFSEYSLQNPVGWQLIRPILMENKGWAIFNFTPRGKNHAWDLYSDALKNKLWYVDMKTVDHTLKCNGKRVLEPEDIGLERLQGMPEELIQQEFYCSFSGSSMGSYYGSIMETLQKEGRLKICSYDPNLAVDTFWDLGRRDATAIWFTQEFLDELRIIDYYEKSGEALPHFIKAVKDRSYAYGHHYAPHDIEVKEMSSGISRREVARNLGIFFRVVPKNSLEEGIDAVRRLLPRCYFDETKCKKGIDALTYYHKEYDERNEVYMSHPVHDWSCHGADAFRTMAMARRIRKETADRQQIAIRDFNIFAQV
jgi:phage terminase large subunit